MSTPFSLRMDEATRGELAAHAERTGTSPSQLVNRYVKEGLRMDAHPAVMFKTTPQGRRAAVLASRPRLQVVDVIGTWRAERQDVRATGQYLHIGEDEVEAVLRFYADYREEVDRDLTAHLQAQENYKRLLAHREDRTRRRVARA